MISALVSLLIVLLLIVAVCYVCFWIIDSAFPEPMRLVGKIVVGIIALLAVVQYVLPLAGLR